MCSDVLYAWLVVSVSSPSSNTYRLLSLAVPSSLTWKKSKETKCIRIVRRRRMNK